jgi:hypothetical protein
MSVSIKNICEFIWWLEDEYQLLTLDADGVKFWQVARMKVYYSIAEELGVLARPHQEMAGYSKIFAFLNYIKHSFSSAFIFRNKVDALIVEHPRGLSIGDNKVVDIYTYYLANKLRERGVCCKSLEPPYLGKHIKSSSEHSIPIDGFSVAAKVLSSISNIKNTEIIEHTANKIEKELLAKFGIKLNLFPLLHSETKAYVGKYKVAKWMLAKLKPSTLYIVVSYGYFHFVKAAKDLGINVIELQHGTYSKYHLGYSYPCGLKDTSYIPDYLHVWNDYWKKVNVLPIASENVLVTGFLHGKEQFDKYKFLGKNKQITVLSQGVIGKQLAAKLDFIVNTYPDYVIYFKLHPGEYGRWHEYPLLKQMSLSGKVVVVEKTDLYKLLAESEYQVGVFSTALFEGIELGCKTILFDLPGIEYMDELISSGEVHAIY